MNDSSWIKKGELFVKLKKNEKVMEWLNKNIISFIF